MFKFNVVRNKLMRDSLIYNGNILISDEALACDLRSERFLKSANRHIEIIDDIETTEGRKQYCNYLISAIVDELTGFYYYQNPASNGVQSGLLDLPYDIKPEVETSVVHITNQKVFSFVWNYDRFIRAMRDIECDGYKSSAEMALGWYYSNLNLIVVYSHNHHVAAAIQQHKLDSVVVTAPTYTIGKAPCRVYATKEFHFANKYGFVQYKMSDPRFVFACMVAQFVYDGCVGSIRDYIVRDSAHSYKTYMHRKWK